MGISNEEVISLTGYNSKARRRQKELEILNKKIQNIQEENIQLKFQIHEINKTNSSLSNQLTDLGQKTSHNFSKNSGFEKNIQITDEIKNLVEENEALRRGMHDILDSINTKKTNTLNEIRSETLEKLLRALDVKHISGWYHPAMRLQAEVHNIEGINTELREQLRSTKLELVKYQSQENTPRENSVDTIDHENVSSELEMKVDMDKQNINKYLEDITKDNSKGTRQQLVSVIKILCDEKADFSKRLKEKEAMVETLEEEIEILRQKYKVLTEAETDEEKLLKIDNVVKENVSTKRRILFIEKEIENLRQNNDNLNIASITTESDSKKIIAELKYKNQTLENDLKHVSKVNELLVSEAEHKELQRRFDALLVNYRELGNELKNQKEYKALELKMLEENQKAVDVANEELKTKVVAISSRLLIQTVQDEDDKLEKLAHSLAQSEIKAMTERQRANHTNNLYQLVKEQLSKSEERFQEYSKYNEDLLKKNLILQEQLKEAEENIVHYVDNKLFKALESNYYDAIKDKEDIKLTITNLEEDFKIREKAFTNAKTWNDAKEKELLNLKHQIVDLVSISDEKVVIAQLNNDVFQCRQSLSYYRNKLKEVTDELDSLKAVRTEYQQKYEEETNSRDEKESFLNGKIQ